MKLVKPVALLAVISAIVAAVMRRQRRQADVRIWQEATSDSSR